MENIRCFVGVKALIENGNGRFLVMSPKGTKFRRKGSVFYDLPGGRINEGEQVEDTLRREVSEELGIGGNELIILDIFDVSVSKIRMSARNVPLLLVTFECGLTNYNQKFVLSREHSLCKWVPAQEAAK